MPRASLAGRTLWSALATGSNAAYFVLLIPLITKLGGLTAYGLWEGTALLVNLLAPLAWLGLRSGFTRYSAGVRSRSDVSASFHAVLVGVVPAALLLGAAQLAVAPWIASQVVGDAPLGPAMFRWGALLLIGDSLLLVVLEHYRATLRLRPYALLVLGQRVAELAAVTALLAGGHPVTTAAATVAAIRGATLALAYGGVLAHGGLARPDLAVLRPYIAFGFPLLVNEVLGRVLKGADRLIVGHYRGVDEMGAYGVVVQLCLVFVLYIATLQVWLYPHLSALWNRGARDEAVAVLGGALRAYLLVALPTAVGVSALGPSLIALLSEPDVAVRTAWVLPLVAAAFLVYGVGSLTLYALALVERTAWVTVVLVLAAAVNLGCNVALVPRIGMAGAGLANAAGFSTMAVLMTAAARRHLPVRVLPGGWVLPRAGLACAAMGLVLWALGPGGGAWTGVAVVAGALTYGAVLLATRCVTLAEIRAVATGADAPGESR